MIAAEESSDFECNHNDLRPAFIIRAVRTAEAGYQLQASLKKPVRSQLR